MIFEVLATQIPLEKSNWSVSTKMTATMEEALAIKQL